MPPRKPRRGLAAAGIVADPPTSSSSSNRSVEKPSGASQPSSSPLHDPTIPPTTRQSTASSSRPRRQVVARTIDYSRLSRGANVGDDDDEEGDGQSGDEKDEDEHSEEEETEESSETEDSLGSSVSPSPPPPPTRRRKIDQQRGVDIDHRRKTSRGRASLTTDQEGSRQETMDIDTAEAEARGGSQAGEASTSRLDTLSNGSKETSKKSSKTSNHVVQRKISTSASRSSAPPKYAKAVYATGDLRPLYLPASSDRDLLQIDEILPLDQIGRRNPRTRLLKGLQAQEERARRHRVCWSSTDHFMRVQGESLAATDWTWYPGKSVNDQAEEELFNKVNEYWRSRKSGIQPGANVVDEIQKVGGVFLLDRESEMNILNTADGKAYRPPPYDLTSLRPPPKEPLKSVEDFVERGPSCSSAEGTIKVAMGVPSKDEVGRQTQKVFELESWKAESLQDCGLSLGPTGFIVNAGSFVPSLDWAPRRPHAPPAPEYLAIAVSLTSPPATVPPTPLATYSEERGAVQIWSIGYNGSDGDEGLASAKKKACRLEYVVCVPKGEVRQVKWCPCGSDLREQGEWEDRGQTVPPPRIGLLACILSNQRIAIFAAPRPAALRANSQSEAGSQGKQKAVSEVPHVELSPILELQIHGRHRQALSLDWGGGERLVAGCSDGSLICWSIGTILRSLTPKGDSSVSLPSTLILPSHSLQVHESAILSLSFLQLPPVPVDQGRPMGEATVQDDNDNDNDDEDEDEEEGQVKYDHDGLPHFVLSTALDGTVKIVDLDMVDLIGDLPSRREPGYSTSFLPFLGSWLAERGDNTVRLISARPVTYGKSNLIASHDGRCTTVDGSPFHPMVASGGADGAVKITNALKNVTRDAHKYQWPLYRLDLNRFTGEVRYVDNILPSPFLLRGPIPNSGSGGGDGSSTIGMATAHQTGIHPGAWHPIVGVTGVRWNPNVTGPVLLASCSALGLVRLDMVCGFLDGVKVEGEEEEGGGGDDDDDG